MVTTDTEPNPDPSVLSILGSLADYESAHPEARVEVRRRNPASIGIQIVDPSFRGLDRVEREERIWPILEQLPEDTQADISLLLLLTPEEAKRSDSLDRNGGVPAANPILEAILGYLREGRQFDLISPEKHAESARMVTFRFADGSVQVLAFHCDHPTFMKWWKEATASLRQVADAFPTSAEAG